MFGPCLWDYLSLFISIILVMARSSCIIHWTGSDVSPPLVTPPPPLSVFFKGSRGNSHPNFPPSSVFSHANSRQMVETTFKTGYKPEPQNHSITSVFHLLKNQGCKCIYHSRDVWDLIRGCCVQAFVCLCVYICAWICKYNISRGQAPLFAL